MCTYSSGVQSCRNDHIEVFSSSSRDVLISSLAWKRHYFFNSNPEAQHQWLRVRPCSGINMGSKQFLYNCVRRISRLKRMGRGNYTKPTMEWPTSLRYGYGLVMSVSSDDEEGSELVCFMPSLERMSLDHPSIKNSLVSPLEGQSWTPRLECDEIKLSSRNDYHTSFWLIAEPCC